eukprot:7595495-Pyramimonas_sp.AAC.1
MRSARSRNERRDGRCWPTPWSEARRASQSWSVRPRLSLERAGARYQRQAKNGAQYSIPGRPPAVDCHAVVSGAGASIGCSQEAGVQGASGQIMARG